MICFVFFSFNSIFFSHCDILEKIWNCSSRTEMEFVEMEKTPKLTPRCRSKLNEAIDGDAVVWRIPSHTCAPIQTPWKISVSQQCAMYVCWSWTRQPFAQHIQFQFQILQRTLCSVYLSQTVCSIYFFLYKIVLKFLCSFVSINY